MPVETLSYEADGLTFKSQLYTPAAGGGRKPGVLVFPDAGGVGAQVAETGQKLADLGFVALAADYYGDGQVLSDFSVIIPLLTEMQQAPEKHRARAAAALAALTARPEVDAARIAAIGYCFGGTTALELARAGASIGGVVGFHSGLQTAKPAVAGAVKAKVLVCLGAEDPMVHGDQRRTFIEEMTAAGVDWQMHLYGGAQHSFTAKDAAEKGIDGLRYDANADARSWTAMLDFFREFL